MKAAIQYELDHPHYKFEGGQRHAVEVDYNTFRAELVSDLASAGVKIPPRDYNISTLKLISKLFAA